MSKFKNKWKIISISTSFLGIATIPIISSSCSITKTDLSNLKSISTESVEMSLNYDSLISLDNYVNNNLKNHKINEEKIIESREKTLKQINNIFLYLENKNIIEENIYNEMYNKNKEFRNIANQLDEYIKKVEQNFNFVINNEELMNNKKQSLNQTKEQLKKIKIAQASLITLSAASAVAATAFWASAWFFGITIKFAIASTLISTICSSISAGLSIAISAYNKKIDEFKNTNTVGLVISVANLGASFFKVLYPIIISSKAIITASAWAFPFALSIIPVIGSLIAWIGLFK